MGMPLVPRWFLIQKSISKSNTERKIDSPLSACEETGYEMDCMMRTKNERPRAERS